MVRRQLFMNLLPSRTASIADQLPATALASESDQEPVMELAQLEARQAMLLKRSQWVSNAVLCGVGRPF
jgi:hypothetical protein